MSENLDRKYKKIAQVINSAGGIPLPVSDTLIEILKLIVDEQHLDFIGAFRKRRSQTMEQLKESSGLLSASLLNVSMMCFSSVASVLRNFLLAGTL